ncbi:hypothetical protein ERO13_A11G146700v2 [Gossypium hirsutum]|uniref:MATH and LRR domain-containing protein PFE0570w n=1 Tax=Gossypium hirsutum TaxID=3635 RepID=A0A1U8L1R0_GOSHI|nr:MATH and LRR domain-containing protein PFE0570w [Gossypium hirsutum]KAG4174858.1 hypothetical protein ERO13_A11G146700v2 [Gossypium hirsutum]
MKTKSRAVKGRAIDPIPPSNFRLLYQDEANEECRINGNDAGVSEDAGFNQDKVNNDDDVGGKDDEFDDEDEEEADGGGSGGGISGHYDNDVIPDDVDKVDEDEANDEYHIDGNDNGVSEDAGFNQDNVNNNDDVVGKDDDFDDEHEDEEGDDDGSGGGISGHYDNDVIPDDVDMEDKGDNVVVQNFVEEVDESAGVNCMITDLLGGEFGYSCNGRSGQVLVCSENGCSIAIHKMCINIEPQFDDTGKFYCPYCWYKREVATTEELRKRAMLAKRELSNFMHFKRDGGNEEKLEAGAENMKAASLSTMAEEKKVGESGNRLNNDANETILYNQEQNMCVESVGKGKSDDENISKAHGFDNNVVDGHLLQEEDKENTSDSENDGGVLEDNQGKSGKKEPMFPNTVGNAMALITEDATAKVPAIESFEFLLPDLDTGTPVVRQMRIKHTAQRARPRKVDSPKKSSFQPSISAMDENTNQQGKATAAKNSVQCQELTKRIRTPILGNVKRRRLPWTVEEEDILKEGVHRFSLTMNKNIPWRKILEFGHNVFGTNRLPVDLKDKWKKIMAKEDPKSNKGVLIALKE